MIEYGTFGTTVNFQDYQTTLNNGAVLSAINSISGNVNYAQENFQSLFIQSANSFLYFDYTVVNFEINTIESQGINIASTMQSGGGSFKLINYNLISSAIYGYQQYQTSNIKFGSIISNSINGTYIELDNTLPGVEKINMYIGDGIIRYITDEIRYNSKTPGSLIQGSKSGAAGFLKFRVGGQLYKIRIYNP